MPGPRSAEGVGLVPPAPDRVPVPRGGSTAQAAGARLGFSSTELSKSREKPSHV